MIKQLINGKWEIWGEKDTKKWIDKFVKRKIKQFKKEFYILRAGCTDYSLELSLEKFIRSIIKTIKK